MQGSPNVFKRNVLTNAEKSTTNQQNKFDITILISLYENFRANDTPAHSGET